MQYIHVYTDGPLGAWASQQPKKISHFNAKDMCELGIIPCVGLRITSQTECGMCMFHCARYGEVCQVMASFSAQLTNLNDTLVTSASHDTPTRSGITLPRSVSNQVTQEFRQGPCQTKSPRNVRWPNLRFSPKAHGIAWPKTLKPLPKGYPEAHPSPSPCHLCNPSLSPQSAASYSGDVKAKVYCLDCIGPFMCSDPQKKTGCEIWNLQG